MAAWDRWWFQPGSPEALAACRLFFYGSLLALYAGEDFSVAAEWASLHWKPVWSLSWLPEAFLPSREGVRVFQMIFKASLFFSMIGLATRWAAWMACVSGFLLFSYFYSAGRMSHEMAAPCLVFLILAAAPSGAAWSMDARLWPRKLPDRAEFFWPLRLVRVVIALAFFGAGYSKLRASGLDWIASDYLRRLLEEKGMPLGTAASRHPLLCHGLAALALGVEFFYPLALFFRPAARLWVPAGFCLVAGFYFFMGVEFFPLLCLHVFWLPWEKILPPETA
jgi:hypothetical protein